MSKALELIRALIDGANEYEKKTGNTNPTVYLSKNNLLIIEKALLKAQEPKQYLKWEDLEFKENKEIDVLMNGNKYVLELRPKNTRMENLDEIILYNIEKYGVIALNEIEAETFNDLHLERVEE